MMSKCKQVGCEKAPVYCEKHANNPQEIKELKVSPVRVKYVCSIDPGNLVGKTKSEIKDRYIDNINDGWLFVIPPKDWYYIDSTGTKTGLDMTFVTKKGIYTITIEGNVHAGILQFDDDLSCRYLL
jgi:hypothetical protein